MLTKREDKLLLEHTEEEWDLVLDINLKGSFNILRAVAPQMIEQKDGHIMLVSSGTGLSAGQGPFKLCRSEVGCERFDEGGRQGVWRVQYKSERR